MNHYLKIILLLYVSLIFNSCNQKLEQDYPKTVSYSDELWSTNSLYEKNIDSFEQYPDNIQKLVNNYLTQEIGLLNLKKSRFNYGYIASNRIIKGADAEDEIMASIFNKDSEEIKELEAKYNYPVYGIAFEFSDAKRGIKKYDLTFVIDSQGKIIKNITVPKVNLNTERLKFMTVDSIHKILSERNISSKKLNLLLRFDDKNETLFYYVSTLISKGSITGPSCLPESKKHFKLNAVSGEIVEFDLNNLEYY